MKAKKAYKNGGKYPKGLNKTPKKGLKRSKNDNKKMVDIDRLKIPSRPKGLKKSEEDNKKMVKIKKGGRMFENGGKVTGAKTEKSRAGKSYVLREGKKLIEKREQEQLERSVRESRRAKRINESEARRAKARPDYRPKKKLEEGLRDDDGRILSANKLGRKDVTKLEMTSPKKEIKKSTAKIPVPAKKRRLRLRRRK